MTLEPNLAEGEQPGGVPRGGPVSYTLDCVVMDTETTGFDVEKGARLIEIARRDVQDGKPGEQWAILVNPGIPIPADATKVHGITDEMVKGAPRPIEIASGLRFDLGERMLCFHNAPFDLPFLAKFFEEGGAPALTNPVVDTLGLARSCYGTGKNSLGEINARLGLPAETAHRAAGDVIMTARILVLLAGWHERHRGIKSFSELAAMSQDVVRKTSWSRK